MLFYFTIGLGIAVISWLLVRGIESYISRNSILDMPNERSMHTVPTPRGGGIAIVVLTWAAWALTAAFPGEGFATAVYLGYLAAGGLVAGISWLDDMYHLSTATRFAAHSAAAVIVLLTCGWWEQGWLPGLGDFSLGWLGIPLSFLWIVGLTNAYNFMDGIDGIAAGQALVAGIAWMFVGQILNLMPMSILGTAIAGSSLGFLFHNWSPAKIFMGDVGSAFLGFSFAFLTVWASQRRPHLAELGILFLWPFVFDSILTFSRRLLKGENVFTAHRSHLYQRLVRSGLSHRQVSGLYIALAGIGFLPALADNYGMKAAPWLIAVGISMLCAGLWAMTAWREKA